MKNSFPNSASVESLRLHYPAGTRVALVVMNDPYSTLVVGDEGSVVYVDDTGTIHVQWDNGSNLGAVYGVDLVRKL